MAPVDATEEKEEYVEINGKGEGCNCYKHFE
jgi:hypothetical protein